MTAVLPEPSDCFCDYILYKCNRNKWQSLQQSSSISKLHLFDKKKFSWANYIFSASKCVILTNFNSFFFFCPHWYGLENCVFADSGVIPQPENFSFIKELSAVNSDIICSTTDSDIINGLSLVWAWKLSSFSLPVYHILLFCQDPLAIFKNLSEITWKVIYF